MSKLRSAEEIYNEFLKGNLLANQIVKECVLKAINQARIEAIKECAERAKVERISDSDSGKIFNQDNNGCLCVSSFWGGQYIRINEQSILSILNEIK